MANVREETLQGRQIVGRFVGIDTARRKATERQAEEDKPGTPVQGMYLLTVVEDLGDRERRHELTFFEVDQEGDVTKIGRTVEAGSVHPGDLVSVRFKSGVSKGKYVSDTAVSMTALEKSGE
jgi:hypothetical protein